MWRLARASRTAFTADLNIAVRLMTSSLLSCSTLLVSSLATLKMAVFALSCSVSMIWESPIIPLTSVIPGICVSYADWLEFLPVNLQVSVALYSPSGIR